MSTVRCDVCAEPACRACPCLNRFFCSDECQSVDWHELGHHVTCSGAPAQAVESSRAVRARTSRSTRSPQKSIARKSEFTNEKQINTATNTGETEKRRLRSRKPSNRHTQTSDGRSMGTLGEHTPSTSSFVYTSSTRPFTDLKDFHSTNTSTRVSTRSSRSIVSRYESQAKNIDHSAADDGLGPFTTSTLPQATLDTTSIASVPASPLTIPTSVHQTFHCNQTSDTHEASRIVGDGEGSSDYAENEASSFPNLGRPYACEWPTCSLTFTMPSSLTSHARTHDKHGLDGHGTEAVTCQNEYTGTRTTYQKKARIRSAGYVSDPEGADNPVIRIDTGRMSKRKRKMSGRTVVQSSINDAISSCEFTTCPDNIVVAEATVSIRSLSENETKAIDDSPNSLIDESRIQLTTRKRKSYYSASDTPLRSMSNVGETTIDEHDGDDVVYRDSLCADSEIQTAEDTALSPPTRNIQNTTDGTTAKFLSLTSRKGTSHSDNVVIVEENPAKPGPGRRSNNAREYQCTREDCDKRYAQKADLTFHMKSHSRQSLLYECEWEGCEKVFSKASHLEYHIPAHTGERRWPCSWQGCGKSFPFRSNLVVHARTHTDERPYSCTWRSCTLSFRSSSHLSDHMRTHTGDKFSCTNEGCEKSFAQRSGLKAHLLSHAGKKPNNCTWQGCEKSFGRKSNLVAHIRIHTGEKPFKCSWPGCHKSYSQGGTLKSHERAHNGVNFVCKVAGCCKSYVRAGSLSRHMEKTHT